MLKIKTHLGAIKDKFIRSAFLKISILHLWRPTHVTPYGFPSAMS